MFKYNKYKTILLRQASTGTNSLKHLYERLFVWFQLLLLRHEGEEFVEGDREVGLVHGDGRGEVFGLLL